MKTAKENNIVSMPLKVIYLINFLDVFSLSLSMPLLHPHVISMGGSLSLAGSLASLVSGAQLFASPIVGGWSDTRGRKSILVITLIIVLFSNALSSINIITTFFIARIVYGIAHQTEPLLKALLADTVPKEELTSKINRLMTTTAVSFIIGPIIGGVLYEHFGGFLPISILACILDIMTISTVLCFIEDKKKATKETEPDKTFLRSIADDLKKVFGDLLQINWSKYGHLLAIKLICEIAFSLFFANVGLILLHRFLLSRTQIGFAIAYISITMIAAMISATVIAKRLYGSDKSGYVRLFHSYLVFTAMFPLMYFVNNLILYLVLFTPIFIAKALLETTWTELINNQTPDLEKGVMMGAGTSMVALSGLICPLFSGVVADWMGLNTLVLLPTLPAIFGIVYLNRIKQKIITVPEKAD